MAWALRREPSAPVDYVRAFVVEASSLQHLDEPVAAERSLRRRLGDRCAASEQACAS
jgi:hypothetical protein